MHPTHPFDHATIIAALTGDASKAEFQALAAWRARSPDNEREYRRLARVWLAAGEAQATHPGDVARAPSAGAVVALAQVRGAPEQGRGKSRLPATDRERASRFGSGWVGLGAVAAAAVVVLGIDFAGTAERTPFGPEALVTGENEVATVTLQDGTVVRLAPESRLTFGGEVREVSLTGRAYFAVTEDPQQPFRVLLPSGDIQVLGTRFDVESRGLDVRVAVVEGAVQVRAHGTRLALKANEVATVSGPGSPEVHRVDDPFQTIDWLQGFLAFESTPLRQVAEELRQRFGIRFEVVDEALWERTLTGWFADQTPRQMIDGLCTVLEAECEVVGGVVTMGRAN